MEETFPDLGPMMFDPEPATTSPLLTHVLNMSKTECIVCGTRAISNQMCHGYPSEVPAYIDISSPETGSEKDPTESTTTKAPTEVDPDIVSCWCKYEDPDMDCELKYLDCPGNIPGAPAIAVGGWLHRREVPPDAMETKTRGSGDKPSLKQLDIRECLDPEHDIPEIIKEAVVSVEEGDDVCGREARFPRDICLAPRDTASADRELWAIRSAKRHILKPGESRKIRTNLVLPRCRSPHHAAKIEGPAPHWTANRVAILVRIKQGVLDPRRTGRLHVDLYNMDEKSLIIQTGTVVGQFTREPLLSI